MPDSKRWAPANIVMHVAALALAGCVFVPVQKPVSCPPGAYLRETDQGPQCVADHGASPRPSDPVATAPDQRDEPGWSAPPPADSPPVPGESSVAPGAAPAPPPPLPGAEPAPSSPAPPPPAAGPGAQEGSYAEWYENGAPRLLGAYSAGRKHGVWITWYEDGVVAEKVTYEMGVEHGSVERFHPGGAPRERGSYEHGTRTGVWETWHEDGSLRWRGQYENGRPHGPWEIRDEDGRVARGPYVNGARHGAWELETPAGGEPGEDLHIERGQFVGGRRDGVWITLGRGGWKQSEGRYDRGTKVGRWRVWSQGGRLVADVHYHDSGELHGSFTSWHDNGVVAEQGEVAAGVKVGVWIARDRDGGVLYRGSYRHGKKHGLWQERAQAGGALEERVYERGKVIPRRGFGAHLAFGTLKTLGDASAEYPLSIAFSLTREHRQGTNPYFLGYGVELLVEDYQDLATNVAVGVPLRAGILSASRRRGRGLALGTYVYAQVTPIVRRDGDEADVGARLSVGVSSPGLTTMMLEQRKSSFNIFREFVSIAIRSINHIELVYDHDQARGARAGVLIGVGL
jgi:antitoxin component YwqK of YwqJK toxin-antitoxin module